MEAQFEYRGDDLVVVLPELFHSQTAVTLEQEVADLLDSCAGDVIFDLSSVQLIGSNGFGALNRWRKAATARGRAVVLARPSYRVRGLLQKMGLDTLFDIIESLPKADA